MRNKVDVFNTNSFGFKDQNNNLNNRNGNVDNRKLLQTTDPLPDSEIVNVQRYLKMFLLFTGDMRKMFSEGKIFNF